MCHIRLMLYTCSQDPNKKKPGDPADKHLKKIPGVEICKERKNGRGCDGEKVIHEPSQHHYNRPCKECQHAVFQAFREAARKYDKNPGQYTRAETPPDWEYYEHPRPKVFQKTENSSDDTLDTIRPLSSGSGGRTATLGKGKGKETWKKRDHGRGRQTGGAGPSQKKPNPFAYKEPSPEGVARRRREAFGEVEEKKRKLKEASKPKKKGCLLM